jgi:hypothetical protein
MERMMRRVMVIAVLVLGMTAGAFAQATDSHPSWNFSSGVCWTWGSGKYQKAEVYMRVKETWDTRKSNYPLGVEKRLVCTYMGDPQPVAAPGEYIVKADNCGVKNVIPKVCEDAPTMKCHLDTDCPGSRCVPGTVAAKSYPTFTLGVTNNYDEGWAWTQTWCAWDPWAYGAPTVTTTTMKPAP